MSGIVALGRLYPRGAAEVSYSFVSDVARPKGATGLGDGMGAITGWEMLEPTQATERELENRERAERRAKQTVRRRVMAGDLDHLLSVTYRSVQRDRRVALDHWREFVRLVRRRYPRWGYVQLLEYQERGSLHHHAAVRGFQDVNYLRLCWWQVTGGDGNIDVQAPKGRRNPATMARYLCKYLSKAFHAEGHVPGEHRYLTSQGMNPVIVRFDVPIGEPIEVLEHVIQQFEALYGPLQPGWNRVWREEGWLRGWVCNWG